MRKLSLLLALTLAACGGSSSSKKEPRVAIFVDTAYVNYAVGDPDAEASNMEAGLAAMDGVTYETCTAADIEAVIAGKNVFVLPEQEDGDIADDIDADGLALIYDFVHNRGGELVMARPDDGALALINDAFGYTLEELDADPTGAMAITAAAAGTTFEGGAATLPDLSATDLVAASTLPAGAKVIYADDNGDAAVVVIPNGSGNIILLGWDWFDAMPVGVEDGGWLAVFEAAVNY